MNTEPGNRKPTPVGPFSKQTLAYAGLALVALVAGWIWFRPQPRAELATLCLHLNRSVTNAHCTVAMAPEAFPIANVVDVGPNPDPRRPLPVTLRDLIRSCWIEPRTRDEIARDVTTPVRELELPQFTADVNRAVGLAPVFDLTEGIAAKFKAGPKFSSVKSITIALHKPSIQSLDQGVLARHLADSRIRENCLDAVLKPDSRLIVSVIMAEGLDYKIETKEGATLGVKDLAKGDVVKLETTPDQMKAADNATTVMTFAKTRVVAALFADKPMLEALRKAVPSGSIVKPVENASQNEVRYRIATPDDAVEGVLRTARADLGRIAAGVMLSDGSVQNVMKEFNKDTPSVRSATQLKGFLPPNIAGKVTTRPTNAFPAATGKAQIALEADVAVTPAKIDFTVAEQRLMREGWVARDEVMRTITTPVETEVQLRGEFAVFKRRDVAETVSVTLHNKGAGPTLATVVTRLLKDDGSTVGVPEPHTLKVGETRTFSRELKDLGVYRVVVDARIDQSVASAPRQLKEAIDVTVDIK